MEESQSFADLLCLSLRLAFGEPPPSSEGSWDIAETLKPPLVRGDSPQCGEMSHSDKGDGRRQRVSQLCCDGGVVREKIIFANYR